MGIIVKHVESNLHVFYLKGAEVVVEEKVRPTHRGIIKEACENLGMEGLRTLVITQKIIGAEEFAQWQKDYD
jgi:magnesium-transporting ATPase (P-type)